MTAVLPAMEPKAAQERARKLLDPVAAAYRHYDHPAGARFRVEQGPARLARPGDDAPVGPGTLRRPQRPGGARGGRPVASARSARDETPLVERSGSRVLMPSPRGVKGGALVGDTTAGRARPIRFPEDTLRRHHLYVARTRMGKSTLMHHLSRHTR